MRVGSFLVLIALALCLGCSDSTTPDEKALIIVEPQPWENNITGPSFEYEVAVGESFGPFGINGKMLFMLSGLGSGEWIFATYDGSLMKCGANPSSSSATQLAAIGREYVCFESRNKENPYYRYHLRLVK